MGFAKKLQSSRLSTAIQQGVSRRLFLRAGLGLGSGTAMLAAAGCGTSIIDPVGIDGFPPSSKLSGNAVRFDHGVASGDPTANSVILWSRVTPVVRSDSDFPVLLEVFSDAAATQKVGEAKVLATAERDHTVKIDQGGLQPGRFYWYRFSCNGSTSILGRTKTAPSSAPAGGLKFGMVSCSSFAHGFFNAYRFLAARDDIDAVIHLGDYIYEYGTNEYGTARAYEPATEIITLSDYRTRHAQYKRADEDLKALHAKHPFITIWDDHESTNNSYKDGAENHSPGTEGVWEQRKAWAVQAYDEWMPIRLPEPGNALKIWRKLSYGSLADIFMLDTRLWGRDVEAGTPVAPDGAANAPERQMLGADQLAFLKDGLSNSRAQWKVIGNQVVFHQWILKPGTEATRVITEQLGPLGALQNVVSPTGLNGDSWDGYTAQRKEIMDHIAGAAGEAIDNVVIVTGDVHSSWVADITYDPNNPIPQAGGYNPVDGTGSIATEFVMPSVTSPGLPIPSELGDAFRLTNPHIKYIDFDRKGYGVLTLAANKAECAYFYVSSISTRENVTEAAGPVFQVNAGGNRIANATLPIVGPLVSPLLASIAPQ